MVCFTNEYVVDGRAEAELVIYGLHQQGSINLLATVFQSEVYALEMLPRKLLK